MFERNLWCLCSIYFSSAQSIWVVSLSWERKDLLSGKTLDPNQHNLSYMGSRAQGIERAAGHVCRVINSGFLALLPESMGSCWWQQNRQGNLRWNQHLKTLSFSTALPLSTPLIGASVHIKRVEQISEGTRERFTASYPHDEGRSVSSWYLWVSCPLSPSLVERMRWEAAGFPNAESAWRPQQLKQPGGKSLAAGSSCLAHTWVSVATVTSRSIFSLLALVPWSSLAHVCIFTFYQWCCLMSSLDSMNHPEQLVFATRWQRNTIHVWKEEGAMGLRDFGYVPLTKPSPEIRHHFLRIFSTDTLKIKSSITMFCLSIAMQQNNSTQPTGIKG